MSVFNFEINQTQRDEFAKLLEQSGNIKPGVLMSAIVSKKDDHYVFVDVGLKSEGRIPKEEFNISGNDELPENGAHITVFLEAVEDKDGNIALSYTKAIREKGWGELEEYFQKRNPVNGEVIRKVHGGCIVNLSGVSAFLPKSHFPTGIKELKELFGKQYQFMIIKMDRVKSNIVVSLKNMNDADGVSNFAEGQIVKGVVKNITDSVAFVDIGGVTGRLHISELSWKKINDPNDVLKIDQTIEVKIIAISSSNRISLSLKELLDNPWEKQLKELHLEIGKIYDAVVQNIEAKFMTVEIANSITAKIKVSDVAWMKRYQTFDSFKKGQTVKVKIMEVDSKRNKISASLKHASHNSVEDFANKNKVGDLINCEIVATSELGYVAKIGEQLDGIIPKTGAYLSGSLKIGDTVQAYIWNISVENGHIVLGVKKP